MWRGVVGCLVFALFLGGCGSVARRPTRVDSRPGAVELGTASWYGPGFDGNPTSSGEIYDQYDLTAAHQTLPLGTWVAVTNLRNGREVEVRINDRGPFVKGRCIDLSYAAARALGAIGPGTIPVRIEVLGTDGVQLAAVTYTVQVGAFADHDNAVRLQRLLAKRFDGVYVAPLEGASGQYYRVRVGRFGRRDEAMALARAVAPLGLPAVIVEDGPASAR
jgi:rare lipoprotein A